jgi:hypothetical protein
MTLPIDPDAHYNLIGPVYKNTKISLIILSKTVETGGNSKYYSPHSWTILEGENPRILQKIRSPVFQCSRVHDVGQTLVVFPNKSKAFKLTMNAGLFDVDIFSFFPHYKIFVAPRAEPRPSV